MESGGNELNSIYRNKMITLINKHMLLLPRVRSEAGRKVLSTFVAKMFKRIPITGPWLMAANSFCRISLPVQIWFLFVCYYLWYHLSTALYLLFSTVELFF